MAAFAEHPADEFVLDRRLQRDDQRTVFLRFDLELLHLLVFVEVERDGGVAAEADGGTLFLDEIGELPQEAQGILLRVLEGGRFTRIGDKEEVEVDVRLITATNRDLAAMVRDGKFREDLFHRLNVVQIRVPPLREHKDDIEKIANGYWLKQHRRRLSQKQIEALVQYDYPGNGHIIAYGTANCGKDYKTNTGGWNHIIQVEEWKKLNSPIHSYGVAWNTLCGVQNHKSSLPYGNSSTPEIIIPKAEAFSRQCSNNAVFI